MPRITVINRGRSLVNVQLEGRTLACPNNSKRDAICDVTDGVVTGPPDLLEKIQTGLITVTDWHGLKAPEGVKSALQQHLDQLPSDEREALRQAANEIKKDLESEKLEAVLNQAKPETEAEAVAALEKANLTPPAKVTPPKTPNKVTPPKTGGMLDLPKDAE